MKKLVSIESFRKDEFKIESKNHVMGGLGSTRNESYHTNWESDGGNDTENWTYSDDNSSVISASVTNNNTGTTREIVGIQ